MTTEEKRRSVTVGEILDTYKKMLEGQITTLNNLIRHSKKAEAETYLRDIVGKTLADINYIRSQAGLHLMQRKFCNE